MRKFFSLFFVLLMIPAISFSSSIDFTELSFSELVELKDRLNLEIWSREEWQEVEVPPGTWEIGKDIPAGHWTISVSLNNMSYFVYCDSVDFDGHSPAPGWKGWDCALTGYKNKDGSWSNNWPNSIDIDMLDGMYFINDRSVIFTPYSGKPSLTFK